MASFTAPGRPGRDRTSEHESGSGTRREPPAGGAFPYLVWRLQRGYDVRGDLKGAKMGPKDYLRRFYYDTVGYAEEAHEYLVRLVGADRVMMGSDYCFPIAYERPVQVVTEHPTWLPEQKSMILEGNARRLLKI